MSDAYSNNNEQTTSTSTKTKPDEIFSDLRGEDIESGDLAAQEIESVCMQCYENGVTKILLTKIPFFKEVVISSFACEHCGHRDNEIMNASSIQDNGAKATFKMTESRDLQRNIIRSQYCNVRIEELDFEIPALKTNKGIFTTIEGLLTRAFEDIERDQPLRKIECPEVAEQIDMFLEKARRTCGLKQFEMDENKPTDPCVTIIFRDPSGNSFVENPHAPYPDPRLRIDHFPRTREEEVAMGFAHTEADEKALANIDEEEEENSSSAMPEAHGGLDLQHEVISIPTECPNCGKPAEANFKQINIPFFKQVILMANVCEHCGEKSNEVKSGMGFEPLGEKLQLTILGSAKQGQLEHEFDLARDVLKSDTCGLAIPEFDFEMGRGAINGKFTTIEGILQDIKKTILSNPFTSGDSAMVASKENVSDFGKKIDKILAGELQVTLVLDDPAGNSYIQNPNAPEIDPRLTSVKYERTEEQKEDLGLDLMVTENYS
jgi:zinc finger protein